MMENRIFVILCAAFLILLMGCAVPTYQFCCYYEDAFPEGDEDPVCRGIDEGGTEQTITGVECDEEELICTWEEDDEVKEAPVCPRIETHPCNTSCMGVFCGNFFYDPRPDPSAIAEDESHKEPSDENEIYDPGEPDEPLGMWNAECQVQNMTSLFLRKVENSDTITLNTFRFGVGDSFQEFEEAQYYFPITDQACELNSGGYVDRYLVYAIPNSVEGGGKLCSLQAVEEETFAEKQSSGISLMGVSLADSCISDADCGENEVCYSGKCYPAVPGMCLSEEDCAEGEVCYEGGCVNPCMFVRCQPDETCVQAQCVPLEPGTECTNDDDCGKRETCLNGYCKTDVFAEHPDECTSNADCGEDEVCFILPWEDYGYCRDPCVGIYCHGGEICVGGSCFQTCEEEADCAFDESCVSGEEGKYCKPLEFSTECELDADCEEDEICSGGFCIDVAVGDEQPKIDKMYVCNANSNIKSTQYFDCASRCALSIYGYGAEVEPYNPYLSIYEGERVGNPFAYAPDRENFPDGYPDFGPGVEFLEYYRDEVGPLRASGSDEYAKGTILYGATFGNPRIVGSDTSDLEDDLLFYQYIANPEEGYPQFLQQGTYSDEGIFLDWDGERAMASFFTVEEDPHQIYPWLLSLHSVYNRQFEEGNILADGSVEGGAEFECLDGTECLSGYCNTFDYKRGACVGVDGSDILCDCKNENGQMVCTGSAGIELNAWDKPSEKVEAPVPLSAPIDVRGNTEVVASLPSFAKVQNVPFGPAGEYAVDFGEGEEDIPAEIPLLIVQVGGGTETTRGYNLASYESLGWGEIGAPYQEPTLRPAALLDPCSAVPGVNWWSVVDENDVEHVYCCDGTETCKMECLIEGCTQMVDVHAYTYGTGKHMPRIIENCIGAEYKKYVHVCYSDDGKDRVGIWGFDTGDGGPLTEHTEDLIIGTPGDYDTGYSFCEYLGHVGLAGGDTSVSNKDRRELRCYQWKSGGHFPMGTEDDCVSASEAYLVVEPRRVTVDNEPRWAFGKCLVNRRGNGLELKEYGICESCGYLTMAKQEITALPENPDEELAPHSYDREEMYSNLYCPDLVVSTPHPVYSMSKYADESGIFGDLALAPRGMFGYNSYQFGSSVWRWVDAWQSCEYPNGKEVNGDTGVNTAKPYTSPNAYYINKKLESLMKRNIQPVVFATDDLLWRKNLLDDNYDLLYLFPEDNKANIDMVLELFSLRSYLFEAVGDCSGSDDPYPCSDDNGWISFPGSFLGNTIMNEGAAILVVAETPTDCGADFGCWYGGGSDLFRKIRSRALSTQILCPNCMVSAATGYGAAPGSAVGEFDMEERLREISLLFQYTKTDDPEYEIPCREHDEHSELDCNVAMLNSIDTVAVNMVLRDGDEYCDISKEEERFDYILSEMSWLGKMSLKRFGKPLVVTDFTIDRSGNCWDEASAGRLMNYLGQHTENLTQSGYLGIIYGDWESSSSDAKGVRFKTNEGVAGYRGEFFEGMFTASRNFAGHKFTIFYNEVMVSEKCECIPCTSSDPQELCNGRFNGDGPLCDGYGGGSEKWPEICVREDICQFVSDHPHSEGLACSILFNNGTEGYVEVPFSSMENTPSVYRDVIASLESDEPLCFPTANDTYVTYLKRETNGYSAAPMVFPTDGDPEVQCDPTAGLLDSFCGYYPPVSNYRLSCRVTHEPIEMENIIQPPEMADQPFGPMD